MKIIGTFKNMPGNIGFACSSVVLRYPRGYLLATATIGVISLILLPPSLTPQSAKTKREKIEEILKKGL